MNYGGFNDYSGFASKIILNNGVLYIMIAFGTGPPYMQKLWLINPTSFSMLKSFTYSSTLYNNPLSSFAIYNGAFITTFLGAITT